MRSTRIILILLAFYATPLYAAQGDTYAVLQYVFVTLDPDDGDDVDPTAIVGRFGRFATDEVSVEGRFGIGLQDDEIDAGGFEIDVEVDTIYGIYLAYHLVSTSAESVYLIGGFTQGEIEQSAFGITLSEDESGLSFGFGANFGQFNFEYMHYLDEDEFDATAISLGYIF